MFRSFLLASAICFLPSQAMAEEKKDVVSAEDNKDDAAQALNDFISRAVDQGLLDRPGASTATPSTQTATSKSVSKAGCAAVNEVDFGSFGDFSKFSDLVELANSEEEPDKSDIIQGHMALGLYTEARALNKRMGLDNSYLSNLSNLLENQSTPSKDYYAQFAHCGVASRFWYSVALLAVHDEAGVAGIDDHISFYRSLPFQMQTDVVTIVVPALDEYGQQLLAKKLMTNFGPKDIANSSGLQFSLALLDKDAEKRIDDFIIQPEFRLKALGAIVQRGDTLSTPQRELLLEEVSHVIDQETDERQLTIAVKFALQEFGERSNLNEIVELAKLPKLQTPVIRNLIFQKLAAVLAKDLKSDDQLKVLSTFQFMIDQANTIDEHPSVSGLYKVASDRASELGYTALSNLLSNKEKRTLDAYLQRAEFASRKKDTVAVYTIADQLPAEAQLSLIAAKTALKASDKSTLQTYSSRLLPFPNFALELIKEDAFSGKWLVSEDVYLAAASSPNIAVASKAANILALRRDALAAREKSPVSIASTEQILARSTRDLHPKKREVN